MKILFVCRGNVGRSQMAAGLLKKMFPEYEIFSAGTKVTDKEGNGRHGNMLTSVEGSIKVIEVLKEEGVDISNAKMIKISEGDLENNYDRIVVMAEPENIPEWLSKHPNYVYWEVEDPKGTNLEFHRKTRDEIKKLIEENISLFK